MARIKFPLSTIAFSVSMLLAGPALAAASGQRDALDPGAVARLVADSGGNAQVSIHGATGTARFVSAAPGGKLGARGAIRARASNDAAKQATAAQFLSDYSSLFGISSVAAELQTTAIVTDQLGATHVTYRQVYQGLPVFGGELKSHFDAAGNLTVVTGLFVPGINVSSAPARSADQAAAAALAYIKAGLGKVALKSAPITAGSPTLMVYRENIAKGVEGENHLAWQVEVGNRASVRDFVYVDAHSGKVIDKIAGIHDALNRRAYDGQNATAPGPNYPNAPFWVEGQNFPTGTAEADNMILASGDIYNLFKKAFGRDSFNGNGATMDSIFNRGNACPNASWGGQFISFCPGLTTDDVTAHEWGHAYTEYTHGLIYAWQPGALNEAYSDIWGETVDRINGRGTDTPNDLRTAGSCTAFTNATLLNITAPQSLAGVKASGTASFGPQTFSVADKDVVLANDGSAAPTLGCTAPFANAAAVSGKIAFIDRGTCSFDVKTKNAQLSGAIGAIIGNNAANPVGVINMGPSDATLNVMIPVMSVSYSDATALKAASGLRATLQRGPGSDNSVRWLLGEDSTAVGLTGALRDMYNPTCYGNPGKVSDSQYSCGPASSDSGGVHNNSGVPNHGYALLVDGGTYNGQTVTGIGLTKAAHIYWRAQSVYQNSSSDFAAHADAITQSCSDLTGANLNGLTTGTPSGEIISAADCSQVAKMALAVELRSAVPQCNFAPLLAQSPPALCTTGTVASVFSDNFDGGKRTGAKWLLSHAGVYSGYTARDWGVVNNLPSGRAGYAIFAADPAAGTCGDPTGDQSGVQALESPEITIPAGTTAARMTFDHWVSTEAGFDGGNLKISVNGGAWQLVAAANFIYNPYNTTLATAAAGNTNPLAGQAAFSGSDGGSVNGSWGRSIVNLAPYAVSGDKVKLRFESGMDGCGGSFGWYVDDVMVYRCTP